MAVTFHPDGRVMHNGVNMTPTQMVDQWRVPATFNVSGNIYITSWERNDSSGFAKIGTGMSHSSGVFTFPKTGVYRVDFRFGYYKAADRRYVGALIQLSTNSGGSYFDFGRNYTIWDPKNSLT